MGSGVRGSNPGLGFVVQVSLTCWRFHLSNYLRYLCLAEVLMACTLSQV